MNSLPETSAALQEGRGGLALVCLSHASGACAEAYTHGAHLTSYVPAGGEEVLFVSSRAEFGDGSPIRGGVPVVFPQFAEQGPLPKHGFARVAEWAVPDVSAGDGVARAIFVLTDSPEMKMLWPHTFLVSLAVEVAADRLTMRLDVFNRDDRPIEFTCALHTYFRVADVRQAAVLDLAGVTFHDKVSGGDRVQEEAELAIDGPLDRIYRDAPDRIRIRDGAGRRTIVLRKEGFADAVVWNPWIEGARDLDDMEDDEYLRMLCVEAGSVATPVRLEPGERWTAAQLLSVEGS
jgi:glucose-6-phosphate 1-epimerase